MKPPLRVFCCYARKDQSLLLELKETYLKPLEREGRIEIWADVNINAGLLWEREIEKHLNAAHIILLLVSPDFMASDYAYSKEMMRAMERHEDGEARVIPIILHSTDWKDAPFAKLQALPSDAKPVIDGGLPKRKAFTNVEQGIKRVVEELLTREDPLIKDPQCAWVIIWPKGKKVSDDIELRYDDLLESDENHYKQAMPDDIRQEIDEWCRENQASCKDLSDPEKQPEAVQVRLNRVEFQQGPHGRQITRLHLSPTRYLYYVAIHGFLGRDIELRQRLSKYFQNAVVGLERGDPLKLPSDFALHMAVVSQDDYLLLRQRSRYTPHFPLAWEAGVGEFNHGPGPKNMPGFDVEADPGRPKFPAFTPERKPDLTLFLKNAVAEELDYFKAQEKDFRLYGFAVEYYSLAPKLVVVYNSDRRINDLLDSADEATDPARNLGSMKLTLDIIRKACLRPPNDLIDRGDLQIFPRQNSDALDAPDAPKDPGWGPTSKLVMLLALKQYLEAKGEKDNNSDIKEIKRLIDYFKLGDNPVDPWQFRK